MLLFGTRPHQVSSFGFIARPSSAPRGDRASAGLLAAGLRLIIRVQVGGHAGLALDPRHPPTPNCVACFGTSAASAVSDPFCGDASKGRARPSRARRTLPVHVPLRGLLVALEHVHPLPPYVAEYEAPTPRLTALGRRIAVERGFEKIARERPRGRAHLVKRGLWPY